MLYKYSHTLRPTDKAKNKTDRTIDVIEDAMA